MDFPHRQTRELPHSNYHRTIPDQELQNSKMSSPAFIPDPKNPDDCAENHRRMLAGELYYSWTPDLVQGRARCKSAMLKYNTEAAEGNTSRRREAELLME